MQAKASNEVFAKPLENDTPILKLADFELLPENHKESNSAGDSAKKPSADSYLRKQIFHHFPNGFPNGFPRKVLSDKVRPKFIKP